MELLFDDIVKCNNRMCDACCVWNEGERKMSFKNKKFKENMIKMTDRINLTRL